ncbi:P-loop containing nucleoside triphosphate hydrolase protein [Lophium mytilinum]|uniref:P-loop containing nucleoside triphosphate hydrolase protein n=1 Tax=Lophium mytilinum TaxID=390894 RepID=A0A6A6QGS9_9PEZI|nr:P-loop containing nucleoside triphosphate hydrolase protein [Lophium mytilinum]
MDPFLTQNIDRYRSLVAAYAPPARKPESSIPNPDIQIGARIRPILPDEAAEGLVAGVYPRSASLSAIADVHELRKSVRGQPGLTSSSYTVDCVFGPDDSTGDVYKELVEPLVPWAWGGGVGTLFAYGQTGSGKTFTVTAIERLVAEQLMGGQLEGEREVHVCIFELAGNVAFDLLNSHKRISILEDSFGATQLVGATEHTPITTSALLSLIDNASAFRKTASTDRNAASSRTHAMCRLRIANPAIPAADDGLLFLVDLAGSEAARDIAEHSADRMKETREINTSLSILKDCIRGRAQLDVGAGKGKAPYIPFRASALTKTLKHVFDPAGARACKTAVVACVSPSVVDAGPSKNTLRYAELLRVTMPKGRGLVEKESVPASWGNERVQEWIGKSSGTPPISASLLAPTETGAQLVRLPQSLFISRCEKTPGVSSEQALAFYSKLWRLHIDSQAAQTSSAPIPRVIAQAEPSTPFACHIHPGMFVRYKPPHPTGLDTNIAAILCPDWAVETEVKDYYGKDVKGVRGEGERRYLCAMVAPSIMPGAWELDLGRQCVVEVREMEAEVLMEWDVATRYWFMTV